MRRGVRDGGAVMLTNIKTVRGRDGKVRRYVQIKGHKLVPLPSLPMDHPDFLAAWSEAMRAAKGRLARPAQGSISQLCGSFLRSPAHLTKSEGYQSLIRRHVMAIEAKAGDAQARHLLPRHISADLAPLSPAVAQQRFKAWRALAAHGIAVGSLTDDPTEGVKRPSAPKTDGHPAWVHDEVEAFRDRWKIGTVQRAIFELIFWTGARISDAVLIGPGMVDRGGVLRYRQVKTGGDAFVPWTCPLPAYAVRLLADRDMMHEALAACAGHMTFLATRHGRPRSAKAIGGDVAASARLAGFSKSAHGLRKSRAAILADAGATTLQIGAWTGHESLTEIAHYTRSADRRNAVIGSEQERNVGKQSDRIGKQVKE